MDLQALAGAIKRRQETIGLPWAEIARRAEMSERGLSNIRFQRTANPPIGTLARISVALGWPPDALWRHATGDPGAPDPDGTPIDQRIEQLEAATAKLAAELAEIRELLSKSAPPHDRQGFEQGP